MANKNYTSRYFKAIRAIGMRKYFPLLLILLLTAIVYFLKLHDFLTFEKLKEHRQQLKDIVAAHPLLSPFVFIAVYTTATALSIPGGLVLSVFGGFLFPQPWSTLYVVIAATLGACMLFLAAKTAFGDLLKRKAGPRLKRMQKGFEEDAANYLLFLRLVPIFPFWLVNLAPAFFGVPLSTFAWTTFFGIIPGSFVYTQAGVGLGAIFDSTKQLSQETVFNTQIKIALIGLAIFALLPVIVKKIRGLRHDSKTDK